MTNGNSQRNFHIFTSALLKMFKAKKHVSLPLHVKASPLNPLKRPVNLPSLKPEWYRSGFFESNVPAKTES